MHHFYRLAEKKIHGRYYNFFVQMLKNRVPLFFLAMFFIPCTGFAQAPTISYATPQTFYTGIPVSLTPTSTNVAPLAYSTTPTIIGSGFDTPGPVAINAAGDLFVAEVTSGRVTKIAAGTTNPILLGTFNSPEGIAADAAGNVYLAEAGLNDIKKLPVGGGPAVTVASGLNHPQGMTMDAAGNLYVADSHNNRILEIPGGNGDAIELGSGFKNPFGVGVDRFGNVYVADYGNGAIKMVSAGNGAVKTLSTGLNGPAGVTTDLAGNVYFTLAVDSVVDMLPAGGGAPLKLASGFYYPVGIVTDGAGNLIVGDQGNNLLKKMKPTGGYFISKLPAGLNFDSATGTISGTPTTITAASSYRITGYNVAGGTTATINIGVARPPLPAISYATPQTYYTGLPVTPLSPASANVAPFAFSDTATTVVSGFQSPWGVTTNATGDLFVTDRNTGNLDKIAAGTTSAVVLGTFNLPTGVAVDAAGNIYIAESGANDIKKLPAGGGMAVTYASGITSPEGIALDAAGNLYVTADGREVVKIPAGGGAPVTFASGFYVPIGVAVDHDGNVYVADLNNNAIKIIPAGNGPVVTLSTGSARPFGIALDQAGNIYFTDKDSGRVGMFPAGGGTAIYLPERVDAMQGITVDAAGNLFVCGYDDNGTVERIKPTGGYFINQLPAGLNFNSATGVISGTPTAATAASSYRVTGYNITGGTTATINIGVAQLPLPTISYATPQTYYIGIPVSPLSPSGAFVAPLAYSTTPTTVGSGFNAPAAVAVNAAGDLFIAEVSGQVKKIAAGTTSAVVLGTFDNPLGVAVDAAGNVYVAEGGANDIEELPAGGGAAVILASGLSFPQSIKLDAAGNLYVANTGNDEVLEIPAGSSTPVTLGSGFSVPYDVAVDRAGNVYVADYGNSAIKMIPAGNGAVVTQATGLNGPSGITVDLAGNIYFTQLNGVVSLLPAGGGTPVSLTSGFSQPIGIVLDAAGNLFVADEVNNALKRIKPTGGYFINKLPAGLNFNSATGIISGTPTTASVAASSKVTAYNITGGTVASINIQVLNPASLSSLAISAGTLTPAFKTTTQAYTATVPFTTSSVQITPTAITTGNTIKVNGLTVASGAASAAIPLSVGTNTITTVATAQDGVTTDTYTVTITRAAGSANATLSKITTNTGVALTTVTGPDYKDFAISVPNTTTGIVITPTAQDATATIKVNGVNVASGTASANIPLPPGVTTIKTVVTAQDGVTTKTYAIAITRLSNNALLSSIRTTPTTTLTAVSGPSYRNYTTQVSASVSSIQVTATAQDNGATIKVNGAAVTSGTLSQVIALVIGANVINTIITSSDGSTSLTYTITVTRLSNVATLSKLNTNSGVALTQVTGPDYRDYTLSLPNAKASITITPVTTDATSTVKVNGVTVASGTASAAIPLSVGSTTIKTVVTSQDGSVINTYSIAVTRAASMLLYNPQDEIAADGLTIHPGITPNGDGINDIFTIDGINNYPDNKVTIMNRSGAVIYEAKGYDNQTKFFDGHFSKNGALQLPGTYFYSLEYSSNGKTKVKTGFLVLKY